MAFILLLRPFLDGWSTEATPNHFYRDSIARSNSIIFLPFSSKETPRKKRFYRNWGFLTREPNGPSTLDLIAPVTACSFFFMLKNNLPQHPPKQRPHHRSRKKVATLSPFFQYRGRALLQQRKKKAERAALQKSAAIFKLATGRNGLWRQLRRKKCSEAPLTVLRVALHTKPKRRRLFFETE